MQTNELNLKLQAILNENFSELAPFENASGLAVVVEPDDLITVMQELRDNPALDFDFLTNLTSVDYPDKFSIVYNLVSLQYSYTLEVHVYADKDTPEVPSVVSLYGAADWQEREVYDLMGIIFTGHPDLQRILLGDEFKGYPLRKDFTYTGGRQ